MHPENQALNPHMRGHWQTLMQQLGADAALAETCFQELEKLYTPETRHYHTFAHVQQLLELIQEYRQELKHPHLLELAAWYHDAVYDPTRTDNEAKSAELAEAHLCRMGLPKTEITFVNQLILATAHHRLSPETATPDHRFFLDIDLAILGAAPEKYAQYSRQIRQEFAFVPEQPYRQGRAQVLRHFLDRSEIYLTPKLHQKLEAQARKNVQGELGSITS